MKLGSEFDRGFANSCIDKMNAVVVHGTQAKGQRPSFGGTFILQGPEKIAQLNILFFNAQNRKTVLDPGEAKSRIAGRAHRARIAGKTNVLFFANKKFVERSKAALRNLKFIHVDN